MNIEARTSVNSKVEQMADHAFPVGGSFRQYVEHAPQGFAVTRGATQILVYANSAFRSMVAAIGGATHGRPIAEILAGGDANGLTSVLDRVFREGIPARDYLIESPREGPAVWICSVWPVMNEGGDTDHLVIEVREGTPGERSLEVQRQIAERMLLGALREREVADSAVESSERAAYLAQASRRLAESLDEETTIQTVANVALPLLGAWCIVDIIEAAGTVRRLAIVHPDPTKQALARELESRWLPELDDRYGAPAVLSGAALSIDAEHTESAILASRRGQETLRALADLGSGPILTVPLVARSTLIGAITFVGNQRDRSYSQEDVDLAHNLATRGAMAIDSARLYGEALRLRSKAEAADKEKTAFLGTMSHELRTPLNAIRGYVDLIDEGVRGPVTDSQRKDLKRIRANQEHLLSLVNDLLTFARIGSGRASHNVTEIVAHDAVDSAVALIEPLIEEKGLNYHGPTSDVNILMCGDPEQVQQILLNLLSNAIKFTPRGGDIRIECIPGQDNVLLSVTDTGIGIPQDKLDSVFDPFVQLKESLTGRDQGFGLGLAISLDLARGMQGDLHAESELGQGSRFTLTLPRAGRR